MTDRTGQWRIAGTAILMTAAFAGLGMRLCYLHLAPGEDLRRQALRIHSTQRTLPGTRGRIFDRNGTVLAMDITMHHIWADPEVIQENGLPGFVSRQLARVLELDEAAVSARVLREGRRYEMISRYVPEETAARVMRLQLPGIHAPETYRRTYPHQALMCHVVGFANYEGIGSAGIEQAMHRYLYGKPGLQISQRDGRRRELYERRSLDIAPQQGFDVRLTLDIHLQHIMESALDRAMEQHRAEGAWAILQHTRTGEILAMASRPAFDLNSFRHADTNAWRNRAIAMNYEPGSTFKVAVIAAALNEGVVSPEDLVDCERGRWYYAGRSLRDVRPHGVLTVADVIQKSSNIGAAKIALRLEPDVLYRYMRAFGFGRATGVGLPGEEAGILHPVNHWSRLSVTRLAMGHEVAVTALQLLNAVNAIANDGFLMKPFVAERVEGAYGKPILHGLPEPLGRPINAATAATMRRLMARVTESGGTGTRAALDEYRVAGKTGTAQKAVPGGYSGTDFIASFVGFLPAEQPAISLVVVIDTPRAGVTSGGAVAGPVFKEIAEASIRYLASRPDGDWAVFRIRAEG